MVKNPTTRPFHRPNTVVMHARAGRDHVHLGSTLGELGSREEGVAPVVASAAEQHDAGTVDTPTVQCEQLCTPPRQPRRCPEHQLAVGRSVEHHALGGANFSHRVDAVHSATPYASATTTADAMPASWLRDK